MNQTQRTRILIVEDEAPIRAGLADVFVYHGFDVATAEDGPGGLAMALSGDHDLVVLDVMLPGMDGFEICERVRRAHPDLPIIMLTAKADDDDVVMGLTLGADDYVPKPFSIAQLLARVNAVLRRTLDRSQPPERITLGGLVDIDVRNLSGTRCGEPVVFTRKEMDILVYLHGHGDRPVDRDELLHKVWGYARHLDLETRTVDIHIAKLRRKVEPEPSKPRFLVTVRGAGYRLRHEA